MADLPSALNHHDLSDLERLSGAVALSDPAARRSCPNSLWRPKSPVISLPESERHAIVQPLAATQGGRGKAARLLRHRPHHALPEDETIRVSSRPFVESPSNIALDATCSIGDVLSGVGLYSHEILMGLAPRPPGYCASISVTGRIAICVRAASHLPAKRTAARLLAEPLGPRGADLSTG